MSHSYCNNLPSIRFIPENNLKSRLRLTISDEIGAAKNRVIIAATSISQDEFSNFHLANLTLAEKNGIDVRFYVQNDALVIDYLKSNNFSRIYAPSSSSQNLQMDAIIIDQKAYVIPNFFIEKTGGQVAWQVVEFSDCDVAVEDIMGFLEFYALNENDVQKQSAVIPRRMTAKSSAIRPTFVGNSSFYNFHSSNTQISPLRIPIKPIVDMIFTKSPKELYVFSTNLPTFPSEQAKLKNYFSFYVEILALIIQSKTKVNFIVPQASLNDAEQRKHAASFLAYPNVDLRVTPSNKKGPQFIIADDKVLLFSTLLEKTESKVYLSLHTAINDVDSVQKAKEYFNKVWDEAQSLNVTWSF